MNAGEIVSTVSLILDASCSIYFVYNSIFLYTSQVQSLDGPSLLFFRQSMTTVIGHLAALVSLSQSQNKALEKRCDQVEALVKEKFDKSVQIQEGMATSLVRLVEHANNHPPPAPYRPQDTLVVRFIALRPRGALALFPKNGSPAL